MGALVRSLAPADLADLARAKALLESPSLAIQLANAVGSPVEYLLTTKLPRAASGLVDRRLPGYTGLAVPILDAAGQAIGALSCALARPRMTDARRQALVQAMTQEAQQVVRHLGS